MATDGSTEGMAEQRRNEQAANLRLTRQLLDIGIFRMDLATGRLEWCEHAHHVYGVMPDALAPDFDAYAACVHPDDRGELIACFAAFTTSRAKRFEFAHRTQRPDGAIRHVRGVAEREDRDGADWLAGVVQDVSAEAQAREALGEASRMQRIAQNVARLGSWRIDLSPARTNWSAQTAAIHCEPEGAAPSLDDTIGRYVPEDRERLRRAFTACVEAGTPFDEIAQLVQAKGNRIWVRAIGEPVRDQRGTIVGLQGAYQDISDLMAARDRSEGLARRLRETLERISDAFCTLDQDWRFTFLNGMAAALFRRDREDLLGRVVWEVFPAAVGNTYRNHLDAAIETGAAVHFREYHDELETWFDVSAHPTPDGLAIYFRDVTQQQARDEQLRLLVAAVSNLNDMVLITEAEPVHGPDGPKIVYVNDAFVRLTGFSREEAIGKTPHILQGPKTQSPDLDRIREALVNWRPVRAELINYTKAGQEFWLELDIVPLADESGKFTHWVSVERDITERKDAQAAIDRNEERFRLVAKATNDVVWDWDMTAGTVWWNANLQSLFGYDPAEIAPGPESWADHIRKDDRDRVLDSIDAAIGGQATTWVEEYRFLHADGHPLTVIDRAFVIRNVEGKVVRMLGSMVDVTGERDMENRLRQAQKLEAVGQLTGGVAHDFNNLLTVILGNAEMLLDGLDDQKHLSVLADMIIIAAERGAELTNRLLAFSRRQPLQPQLVDPGALLQGMEGLLRRTMTENIDIQIHCAADLWRSEVDPSQLEAAILNLALNGRDAMPQGGRLFIEVANAAMDDDRGAGEYDVAPGDYVAITVTDTGEGIAPDVLARIFEPFFTTKEVGKGSGLGLSMVYGFVEQSGGHVHVESEPGEGTSVRLFFGRAQGTEAPVHLPVSDMDVVGGHETLLVVEDDALVRDNLVAQLRGLGYTVLGASSAPPALDILGQNPQIDLLFTDVVMPGGMNGRELADAARNMRPGLKFLFTSGYSDDVIGHHGRLEPGVDLISKPYRRDLLAAKVREVLDLG